jgi:predicted nucleic acid-binding protein
MIILETTILIRMTHNDKEVLSKLRRYNSSNLATTAISIYELYIGAYVAKSYRAQKVKDIVNLTRGLKVLPYESSAAKQSTLICSELMASKAITHPREWTADILIAGVARSFNTLLITSDQHFKKMKGLQTEFW